MVPELSIEVLQGAMDKKATKLTSYKEKCDSVWLLLASSGLFPSSHFRISEGIRNHFFLSPFDLRILLQLL
jgi:hypothetical protein